MSGLPFGRDYQLNGGLFDQGMDTLTQTLRANHLRQQQEDDRARIAQVLARKVKTTPVVGQTQEEVPGQFDEGTRPAGFVGPGPMIPRTRQVPVFGAPQERPVGIDDLSPEDITQLLMMQSGEGTRAVNALEETKKLKAPNLAKLTLGEKIMNLDTRQTVADNPKPVPPPKFEESNLPLDVQHAKAVAMNLEADPATRRQAADYYQQKTGQTLFVAGKIPPAGESAARIRSVNGGLYYVTGKTGENGQPEVKELIPPGLSPNSQAQLLMHMLDKDLISNEDFTQGMGEIKKNMPVSHKGNQQPPQQMDLAPWRQPPAGGNGARVKYVPGKGLVPTPP